MTFSIAILYDIPNTPCDIANTPRDILNHFAIHHMAFLIGIPYTITVWLRSVASIKL